MGEEYLGEWKLISSENFDDLLKQLQVSAALRTIGGKFKPKMRFEKMANGTWKITSIIPIRSHSMSFKLGESFIEEAPFDGRKHKMLFSIEDAKLVQRYLDENNNDNVLCVLTREIMPDGNMKAVSDILMAI